MVGNRSGLYSDDPETAWAMDSILEAVEDNMEHYGKYLVPQVFKNGQADKAAVDELCLFYSNLCKLVERRLTAHGKKYLVGEKPSVADCKLISVFYNSVYNDNMPMGVDHREKAKQTIAQFPNSQQYLEQTVPLLLGQYLANRPIMRY